MGQVLHGSATTTHAIRAAIQRPKVWLQALSERYRINPKTVAEWRRRTSLEDRPMGPKVPRSTVLSVDEETLVIEFRPSGEESRLRRDRPDNDVSGWHGREECDRKWRHTIRHPNCPAMMMFSARCFRVAEVVTHLLTVA